MPPIPQNLEERYCAAHKCTAEQFLETAFWECLHRRAVPLAHLMMALNSGYFAADRELIASIAKARTLAQVDEELMAFSFDLRSVTWLRTGLNIRISGKRVIRLAGRYLEK